MRYGANILDANGHSDVYGRGDANEHNNFPGHSDVLNRSETEQVEVDAIMDEDDELNRLETSTNDFGMDVDTNQGLQPPRLLSAPSELVTGAKTKQLRRQNKQIVFLPNTCLSAILVCLRVSCYDIAGNVQPAWIGTVVWGALEYLAHMP